MAVAVIVGVLVVTKNVHISVFLPNYNNTLLLLLLLLLSIWLIYMKATWAESRIYYQMNKSPLLCMCRAGLHSLLRERREIVEIGEKDGMDYSTIPSFFFSSIHLLRLLSIFVYHCLDKTSDKKCCGNASILVCLRLYSFCL